LLLKYKKIISFLPSATEILFELGFNDIVKGVTHACTYPTEAMSKPKIVKCSIDIDELNSIEIDEKIKELYSNNKKLFVLDTIRIKEIEPDLIISQNICEVCAPPFENEYDQILKILGYTPKNIILNPQNISEILNSIIYLGQEIGNEDKAHQKVKELSDRINYIKKTLKSFQKNSNHNNNNIHIKRPKIICLEWISPFYIAGHWVPQMIEMVDALNGISKKGSQSKVISIDEIEEFRPDKIVIMPCGFDIERTEREAKTILNNNKRWQSLEAVKMDEIYIVDANSYFSKPSPRVITGIEIIAKIVYPLIFKELDVPLNSFRKLTQ